MQNGHLGYSPNYGTRKHGKEIPEWKEESRRIDVFNLGYI